MPEFEPDDRLYANGIDVSTGDYAREPLSLADAAKLVLGLPVDEGLTRELKARQPSLSFGTRPGVDPTDLAQAGWGAIFAHDAAPEIREALAPLLEHRRKQAEARDAYFRILDGPEGLRPGEGKNVYLQRTRHSVGGGKGIAPGPANPKKLPYYLMLVGSPEAIPYRFQYELDVDYAIGRIWFETTEEYAAYARSVVESETAGPAASRRAAFFGARNKGDRATMLSADHMVKPLVPMVEAEVPGWTFETHLGDEATKDRLVDLLGGSRTPSLLFTATHGAALPSGHPDQARHQGALICQDWPGPVLWRKPLTPNFFVSAEDIASDRPLDGLVAFFFACFGAGTPKLDDFGHRDGVRSEIAPTDLVAALPRTLLGRKRGALAVIGHIDRAWSFSFQWGRAGDQLDIYQFTLQQILAGMPVGLAIESINQFYASVATLLSNTIEDVKFHTPVEDSELVGLWTAHNDARNFVILGDPAARIRLDG